MFAVLKNISFLLLIYNCKYTSSQDVMSFINSKKSINVIDDRYISIAVDPMILVNGINTRLQSLAIAKHLSPAYVRLSSSFDDAGNVNKADKLMKLSASQSIWTPLNRWLITSNFTPVVKLSDRERINDAWDPKPSMALMEEVDKMNIYVVWEMDNTIPHKTLQQYSSDAATLRHVLSVFPASRKIWSVAGGELSGCVLPIANSEAEKLELTQKYLKIIEDNVDAVSWTPNIHESNFPAKVMKTAPATHNPSIWTTAPKTPQPTTFKDALIWAKYLGQAASNGYNVIFKQPKISELQMITPSFWVSIIHKMLIGNEVLDIHNMNAMNKTKCYVFAHSSKNETNKEMKESVTMFVVNMENTESKISAKFFDKYISNYEFESYILTADDENTSKIKMNGNPLTISDLQDQKIKLNPELRRANSSNTMYLNMPAKSIGFFVIALSLPPHSAELETGTCPNRLTPVRQHESDSEMNKSNNSAERESASQDSAKLIIKKASAMEQENDLKKLLTAPLSGETQLNTAMENKNPSKQSDEKKHQLNSNIEDSPRKTRSVHEVREDYINNKHKNLIRVKKHSKSSRNENHREIKKRASSQSRTPTTVKEIKHKENSRMNRKRPIEQQERIKRQAEDNNLSELSEPELSDLIPDEIKIDLIRQQLEHKKIIEEQLNRKLEEMNHEISSPKRRISSDSVDKTSDDNRTTKFRKMEKRSIDDRTKETDAYLNEISKEENFFPLIEEDIYLIKPQHAITTEENKISEENEESSSEEYENTTLDNKISKESSEEFYDAEDFLPSSSEKPDGLVDNVFNTMFDFLKDFHKKIVDYLHYLSR